MNDRKPSVLPDIPGGAALVEWYGRVPNFHDGFVLSTRLASDGPSEIRIHTWRMTSQTDERGYFILDKHAVVTFALEDILEVNLNKISAIGCIMQLDVTTTRDGFEVRWEDVSGAGGPGIEGSIRARRLSVSFVPGKPPKSGARWAEAGFSSDTPIARSIPSR
jgi:hypothetical protein